MTVYELSRDQLDELKHNYFWGEDTAHIPKYNHLGQPALFAGDIPDSVIYEYYTGIDFVNDDFSCTANMILYDDITAERCRELVDVLTPQQTADLLGRPVKSGTVIYYPSEQ